LLLGFRLKHRATGLLLMVSRVKLCLIHALSLELMTSLVQVRWADRLHHLRVWTLDKVVGVRSVPKEAVHWHHNHVTLPVVFQDG